MNNHGKIIRRNIETIERVMREGRAGHIAVRYPETAVWLIFRVDQNAAREIIATYLDWRVSEIRRTRREGGRLSRYEKRLLKWWRTQVPHFYNWVATPDGRHFLLPLRANYTHCSSPPEWRELAAHPSAYNVGWIVPSLAIEEGYGSGIICFSRSLDDENTFCWRLTRLDIIDNQFWERRVAKNCRVRPRVIHGGIS